MHDFRRLQCWEKAQLVARLVHQLTEGWHWSEPLRGQMRRSAVSVGSNIAEGCGRGSDAELARFLSYAAGSASELDSQLSTAIDLRLSSRDDSLVRELDSLKRSVYGLRRSIVQRLNNP